LSRDRRSQSSHERSEEERERDRAERARRRAERTGQAPPQEQGAPAAIPAPAPNDEELATAPPPELEPSQASEHSPEPELPQPTELSVQTEILPPPLAADTPGDFETQPQEDPGLPAANEDPAAAESVVPEPVEDPVAAEPVVPAPVEDPVASEPIVPAPVEDPLAVEPAVPPPVEDPVAAEQASEPEAVPSAPVAGAQSSRATVKIGAAGRRAPAPAGSARSASRARGSLGSVRHSRRRSALARTLALLALAAVIAAVVLLVKSLLSTGSAKTVPVVPVGKVVIPEGKTRLQIAQIASKDGLTGSYRGASKRSPLLNPSSYGAPSSTHDLEGFLFPATYDVYRGAPVSRLVQEQLIAFRENFGPKTIARAHALHVTPYGLLTVASMIEREAQVPGDRAKIAAVIYNRLRQGTPLGIDATIYYAVEQRLGIATYTHELTEAQLHISSPYNTRLHSGLPPTPISNPGVASIEAAANPAHVAYLYYVAGADGCGEQVFSTGLAQFEVNVAAYQAAVKKNGGAPPSCKKK
jgi:UPF0755 protein